MTLREMAIQRMDNGGLSQRQANEVMATAMEVIPEIRWTDQVENYPPTTLGALWIHVDAITVEYIDAHVPNAWYRSMFVR